MRASILFVLFITLCAKINCSLEKEYYDLEQAEKYFLDFILKFDKNYSADEYGQRFEIFKKNLEKINAWNDEHPLTVFGITYFTDRSEDESWYGLQISDITNMTAEEYDDSNVSAPSELDWRKKGIVNTVKNQAGCGSCYIFGAVGNIESQYAKKYNELLSLSESQALDCEGNGNCAFGGNPTWVMKYYKKGVESEADYPYVDTMQVCKFDANKVKVKVTNYKVFKSLSNDPEKLKNLLFDKGPLTIAFEATRQFDQYDRGVFSPSDCGARPNHAVLLVGYGKTSGVDTWIVKNSWGTQWGDEGYFYFDFAKMQACKFPYELWNAEVEKA